MTNVEPDSGRTDEVHVSAMAARDPPRQRQPEPGSVVSVGPR